MFNADFFELEPDELETVETEVTRIKQTGNIGLKLWTNFETERNSPIELL